MKFTEKWNQYVDGYLHTIDDMFEYKNFKRRVRVITSSLEFSSATIVQATGLGLFFCLIVLLLSCQSTRMQGPPPSQRATPSEVLQTQKQPETLYLKREKQTVKMREPGSSTGSIWADSNNPTNLFLDERPNKVGDIVMVDIPAELQYKAGEKAGGAAAGGGNGGNKSSEAPPDIPALTPASIPVTQLKMEIVAMEPNGDVYLRGRKIYDNENSRKTITVLAKVPSRKLSTFNLNANEFTQVELNEDDNGVVSEYVAQGWDMNVSRKLGNFVPDMKQEIQALEDQRQGLVMYQKALQDRARAVVEERERLKKDRERLLVEQKRFLDGTTKEAEGNTKQGNKTAATNAAPAADANAQKNPPDNKGQAK